MLAIMVSSSTCSLAILMMSSLVNALTDFGGWVLAGVFVGLAGAGVAPASALASVEGGVLAFVPVLL